MSKKKSKFDCIECKTMYDFFIHECKASIQEGYGCVKCDNWCTKCNKDWAKGQQKKERK